MTPEEMRKLVDTEDPYWIGVVVDYLANLFSSNEISEEDLYRLWKEVGLSKYGKLSGNW